MTNAVGDFLCDAVSSSLGNWHLMVRRIPTKRTASKTLAVDVVLYTKQDIALKSYGFAFSRVKIFGSVVEQINGDCIWDFVNLRTVQSDTNTVARIPSLTQAYLF